MKGMNFNIWGGGVEEVELTMTNSGVYSSGKMGVGVVGVGNLGIVSRPVNAAV